MAKTKKIKKANITVNPDYTDAEIDDVMSDFMNPQNGVKKYQDGTIRHWKDGGLHRIDGPSVVYLNGQEEWFKEGKRHREGGPAITYSDNRREWWQNDILHREDGPAVEFRNGAKKYYRHGREYHPDGKNVEHGVTTWYKDNNLHRIGKPAFISPDIEKWFVDGKLHRLDGPAVINKNPVDKWESAEEWYKHGKLHRSVADGPAITRVSGNDIYYENGVKQRAPRSVNDKLKKIEAEILRLHKRREKLMSKTPPGERDIKESGAAPKTRYLHK